VDALIVVPNDRLALLCKADTTLLGAFHMADEVLYNGVRAISSLITVSGLINLDFADVRTVMLRSGRALMGIGTAEGEDRAIRAANEAIVCPLLEKSSIDGALGVIVNVRGGSDITMLEVLAAVSAVKEAAHASANIIFGAVLDDEPRPEIQVTVIAAGFAKEALQPLTAVEHGPVSTVDQPKAAVSGFDLRAEPDEIAPSNDVPDLEAEIDAASAVPEPVVEDKKGQFLFFPDENVAPPEPEVQRPTPVPEPVDLDKPTFQREDDEDELDDTSFVRRQAGQG
jgi:cell division protein FtsZ